MNNSDNLYFIKLSTSCILFLQEIYKDRKKFSRAVFEVASSDLVNMGISVVSYTLKDIRDEEVSGPLSERDYVTLGVFAIANPSVVCLSVCNVHARYSEGWSFRQYFFATVYVIPPLTSVQNFTEIIQGEPLRRGR